MKFFKIISITFLGLLVVHSNIEGFNLTMERLGIFGYVFIIIAILGAIQRSYAYKDKPKNI